MAFQKGDIPWNRGLKNSQVPWNKDLNRETRICLCGSKKEYTAKWCRKCYVENSSPWNKGKKTGHTPWNKGKTLGPEIRQKLSLARKGKFIGSKNPAWKGGITPETIRLRNEFVRTIQKEVLKRDDYICRICHKRGGELTVDHIQSWSEYAEGRFSMDNCRTLCRACHYEITFGKPMPKDNQWGRRTIIWR